MQKCKAKQYSDQMACECGNVWDMNDPYPPECKQTAVNTTESTQVKKPYDDLAQGEKIATRSFNLVLAAL